LNSLLTGFDTKYHDVTIATTTSSPLLSVAACTAILIAFNDGLVARDRPPCSLHLTINAHACTPGRPELIHPFASAIDEPELTAPEVMVSIVIFSLELSGLLYNKLNDLFHRWVMLLAFDFYVRFVYDDLLLNLTWTPHAAMAGWALAFGFYLFEPYSPFCRCESE
jgi:hypothetical protein